jgi:hypothetical protein
LSSTVAEFSARSRLSDRRLDTVETSQFDELIPLLAHGPAACRSGDSSRRRGKGPAPRETT